MTPDMSSSSSSTDLPKVLQSGLIGRRALLRAYEDASERCEDPALKQAFSRFAEEEKAEYDRAADITRKYGGDPGVVHNVKEEVTSFLSKSVIAASGGPHATARDVAVLNGLEAAGHAGAIFMKEIAKDRNEPEWVDAIDKSIQQASDHMEFLRQQAETLGRSAFD